MVPGEVLYRAADGIDFRFRFAWLPRAGTWRIYILDQPDYAGRNTGAVPTHRLGLPGRAYICWEGRIEDYDDARYIASIWADGTMAYIRTGTFPGPPRQRRQPGDRSPLSRHSESELRAALAESRPVAIPTAFNRPAPHPPADRPAGTPFQRLMERLR